MIAARSIDRDEAPCYPTEAGQKRKVFFAEKSESLPLKRRRNFTVMRLVVKPLFAGSVWTVTGLA